MICVATIVFLDLVEVTWFPGTAVEPTDSKYRKIQKFAFAGSTTRGPVLRHTTYL